MTRPVALVTGGRRGIGLAVAKSLAKAGFDVAITDLRHDEKVDAILDDIREVGGGRAHFVAADVADLDHHRACLAAVVGELGAVTCLVGNAGIASPVRGDMLDLTAENFDRVMGINLRGAAFFCQTVARHMLDSGPGQHPRSIVTVSSVSAEMASETRADYCVSKAGLAMWTRNLALRLAPEGIAVFEVRPGIIKTDMTSAVTSRYDTLIDQGLVPARRWGEGGDIAAIVAGLASGAFGFATGSVIHADGGLSIGRL